jgi:hypothetical protein
MGARALCSLFQQLATGRWLVERCHLLITGPRIEPEKTDP